MSFNEWSTIISIVISVIGIIVGIIGARSLYITNKTKNSVKNVHDSTIQQAQTITINNSNGLDTYAIIKLSRDTTQKELVEIIKQFNETKVKLSTIEQKVDNQPKIHISPNPPTTDLKNGDIWIQTE